MKIQCPKCSREYDLDDSFIGRKVKCDCGEKWYLPPQDETAFLLEKRNVAIYSIQDYIIAMKSCKSINQAELSSAEKALFTLDPDKIIQKYPQFENMCFGKDCPTENQFIYALNLGIDINKKTFSTISAAIDKAKEENKKKKPVLIDDTDEDLLYEYLVSKSPANDDYIEEIKEYHADLPRKITNAEAEKIIDFLEKHHINCPYCNKLLDSTMFSMESCPFCDKSFKNLKIPIFI